MKRFFQLAAALLAVSSLALSQSGWKLDKNHSSIGFSVKHLVISTVSGNFKDFDITLTTAKDDFSDAAVQAVIKMASINTDNTARDNHLKSDDFFNAEKFPEIKFTSTSFEKVGEGKYKITGDLTIRDVTKKVVFDAVYNGSIKTPWGNTAMSWTAATVINRFDYNLKWNKALESGGLIAGQDVTITINLEMDK
jgi:polyisoprenoid-binding protein YceI